MCKIRQEVGPLTLTIDCVLIRNDWRFLLLRMPNLQQRQSDTSNDGKYCLPSQSVVDIVDTPRDPTLGISPNGRWLSFWDNPPLKSIEEVSQQEIKVAGKRLSRYFTSSLARISFYTGLSFKELPDLQNPYQQTRLSGRLPSGV